MEGMTARTLRTGVLCALPTELGRLVDRIRDRRQCQGLELLHLDLPGAEVVACVGGVGKVAAAQAASLLVGEGLDHLLVVGACGALRRGMEIGSLLHCKRTIQADLAVRDGREIEAHEPLMSAWRAVAPGPAGWLVTADRPVLNPWRRMRLARAFLGPCAADMETAAAARVAQRAGVPWAALRVVTDLAGPGTSRSFAQNFPRLGGIPADSVAALLMSSSPGLRSE